MKDNGARPIWLYCRSMSISWDALCQLAMVMTFALLFMLLSLMGIVKVVVALAGTAKVTGLCGADVQLLNVMSPGLVPATTLMVTG